MAYPIIDALSGIYIVDNGEFISVDAPAAGLLQLPAEDTMFYEVIRISRFTPLFWEDHMERLEKSLNDNLVVPDNLRYVCMQLIRKHQDADYALDGHNLRIILAKNRYVVHLIPSYYPSSDQFEKGVPTLIIDWERENPNIKQIRSDYKEAVRRGFDRTGPYGSPFELLLADSNQNLTEGSRSNLFFIQDNAVLSAPDHLILKGITRKYVMEAVKNAGAEVITKMISKSDLESGLADSAFLSGSPIDLLPIFAIEQYRLSSASNSLFRRINLEYQKILNNYIDSHLSMS